MKPTIQNEREMRYLHEAVELRSEDDKPTKIFGYAARFNRESDNLGSEKYQFREIIMPGAFDNVLGDDVRALFNHDSNYVLARSKAGQGSLRIGVDGSGLWYEFDAPDTQAGRDLVESIKRGDVDQSSFAFSVASDGEKWEETRNEDGTTIVKRTISKVRRLYDVSPVTYPAYPDASVAVRSLENFMQEQRQETPPADDENSLSHWQRRMGLID